MITQPPNPGKVEQRLIAELWNPGLSEDLEKFVKFVYPWGKPRTPLEKHEGPRGWQRDELNRISLHIAENKERIRKGDTPVIYQSATASGRGVGKSTLSSWLIHWMMTCQTGSTTIVTANTESQLQSVTWAELGIWHTLSINAHWFERQALALRPQPWISKLIETQLKKSTAYYYALAKLWDEDNEHAFAGPHSQMGMLVIFDEASGIPENIWGVTKGYFTEPILHRYWFSFSNPRRNTGAFFETFHKHRDFWYRRNLDSRIVEGTDKNLLNNIIEQYGEDSDEARVEVKGEFPRQGDKQFISREFIDGAVLRELPDDRYAPMIMGVDVARYGDDTTMICFRRGRDARSIPAIRIKNKDNMYVANECAELIAKFNPDAVCVDAGSGAGVIDRLRELGYKVEEVWFGGESEDEQFANRRTDLWDTMRQWLRGGCISDDRDLIDDLAGPEYRFAGKASDKIMLEPKEEMKKRGLKSPDYGDALACTFAVKIASHDLKASKRANYRRNFVAKDVDYKIFGD